MLAIAFFVLGYFAIVFEHAIKLNKAASALLTGVACWTAYIVFGDAALIEPQLEHHLGEVAGILFFLLGAMTIVELIDAHDGFELITARITASSRRTLLLTIAVLSFFLSAVLDNLTTSIVMMSLVRKLANDSEDRMYFGGAVIIAATAGGAWSPIGDVTTTMLWVGGQVTTVSIMSKLIAPALVSAAVPILWLAWRRKGNVERPGGTHTDLRAWCHEVEERLTDDSVAATLVMPAGAAAVGKNLAELNLRARTGASVVTIKRDDQTIPVVSARHTLHEGDEVQLSGHRAEIVSAAQLFATNESARPTSDRERALVFGVGVGVLLFVPVFKTVTHLPPYMGVLLGLGILWTLTELLHKRKNDESKGALSVAGALQKVDTQSVLFFLGILLAIGALTDNGSLPALARAMDAAIGNVSLITMAIGLASAIVDNVPLVAAAQGMYGLSTFPVDHHFWLFLAYCAGTGGSILIIGSAAGIAVMGMERISFGWYLRKISLPALAGYIAGALVYLALST